MAFTYSVLMFVSDDHGFSEFTKYRIVLGLDSLNQYDVVWNVLILISNFYCHSVIA